MVSILLYLEESNLDKQIVEKPLVFSSIGPYGAHLNDASEYSGSYCDTVSAEKIAGWHKIRIEACIESGVDALAIVTIPCQNEAVALVDMLCSNYSKTKFWLSFQCKVNSFST